MLADASRPSAPRALVSLVAALVLAVGCLVALSTPSATAAPASDVPVAAKKAKKPKVSLKILQNKVEGKDTFTVKWKVKKRPKKTRLVLQRRDSAFADWSDVRKLGKNKGKASLRAPEIGKWTYSLAVQRKRGGATIKRASANLFAYKTVKLDALNYRTEDTVTIGGQLFTYLLNWRGQFTGTLYNGVTWASDVPTSCRWVQWSFAALNDDDSVPTQAEITLSATKSDPDVFDLPFDSVVTRPKQVLKGNGAFAATALYPDSDTYVYANARVSCYTLDGER